MLTTTFVGIVLVSAAVYLLSLRRAAALSASGQVLHSRAAYHGLNAALNAFIGGILVLLVVGIGWSALNNYVLGNDIATSLPDSSGIERSLVLSDAKAQAEGRLTSRTGALRDRIAQRYAVLDSWRRWGTLVLALAVSLGLGLRAYLAVTPAYRARNNSERVIRGVLWSMAAIAVLTTLGIVLSLIFETFNFFSMIDWRIDKFLFGTNWSPLSGVQAGKISPDRVGAVPLFAGTFLITLIAMIVAVPVGLFSAIYLSDFASRRVRAVVKPMLELLAGIPTVVYGFFAAITVAPFLRNLGDSVGVSIASESALAAGLVMGIMIIPFISSLSDDVINAVPQSLRDGSYGLGATKAETIRQVVLPAALPGIVSAVLLGISRAVGETMIVVMAAGQGANLTLNPLEAVTTVTVQIVMLITGDTEADTAAGPAFTLGFALFCVTLLMNILALRLVRRYREMYE
ncbi:phosphate ABC transporter permease subunit PstC [Brevirhabdus sp.]|uniref:phosphate ABC transporter permease subunit PstC n=1 Tax=Brevirhabdus sp. TaxID=2004514 RepID=UPI004059E403